jgi:hypothetical protein
LQLRRDVADETMIRVTSSAVGTPGDHDVGTNALHLCGEARRETRQESSIAEIVAKFSVWEAEENWLVHAEGGGGASSLVTSRFDERIALRS